MATQDTTSGTTNDKARLIHDLNHDHRYAVWLLLRTMPLLPQTAMSTKNVLRPQADTMPQTSYLYRMLFTTDNVPMHSTLNNSPTVAMKAEIITEVSSDGTRAGLRKMDKQRSGADFLSFFHSLCTTPSNLFQRLKKATKTITLTYKRSL